MANRSNLELKVHSTVPNADRWKTIVHVQIDTFTSNNHTTLHTGSQQRKIPLTMSIFTQYLNTQDGVKLAYDKLGNSGPVIVLIHGTKGVMSDLVWCSWPEHH